MSCLDFQMVWDTYALIRMDYVNTLCRICAVLWLHTTPTASLTLVHRSAWDAEGLEQLEQASHALDFDDTMDSDPFFRRTAQRYLVWCLFE